MFPIRLFYGIVLLLSISFVTINSDCGCNKVSRSKIEIVQRNEPPDRQIEVSNPENEENCDKTAKKSQLLELMHENMALIADGTYTIGSKTPMFVEDHEATEHSVHVNAFYIDKYEVSNRNFKEFVDNTGYATHAERFGDSFVFKAFISESMQQLYNDYRVLSAPWWYKVNDTNWLSPEGKGTSIENRMNHPVVHVSWFDAMEYCKWRNVRLPTEIEWEIACRGGKKSKLYAWGNKLNALDKHWLNIWQGEFPDGNTAEDGFVGTCPVDKFRQNDYDLYNMLGNVWEWTDTFWNLNDANQPDLNSETIERVKKGGSYLCHESYCYRYRCAARSHNTADSSSGNLGFRCARTA